MEAALKLIAENGVHGFSLREAARAVKVDPAMVYRYFEDKEDLVRAVADGGITRLASAMRAAVKRRGAKSPEARLRLYGETYVRFARREPAVFRVMFGPDRGQTLPGSETPFALLVQCLRELSAARGVDVDAGRAAALCWAGVHGIAMLTLDGAFDRTQPVDVEALVDSMLDLLMAQIPNS